jgi:hypothetical protein
LTDYKRVHIVHSFVQLSVSCHIIDYLSCNGVILSTDKGVQINVSVIMSWI